jgi:imidazolonepropionase-like amidohydrolase
MKNLIIVLTVTLASSLLGQSQRSYLFLNGWLHVGNGEVLESAAIGVRGDKITLVKNSLAYSYQKEDWDTIIDLMGKHVYPAFVAPNSTLGLTEIDAVRATRDYDEVGQYNPHVRSQIAFNVESKVVSTVKTNGVLFTQSTPRGGRISGTSSVMALDGWNWEDATVLKDDGIHVNWPASLEGGGWWAEPSPKKFNEKYLSEKRELYAFFELAKAYARDKTTDSIDLRLEAMRECFDGRKRVYFHADEIQQLLDVIEFASYFGLSFPVIIGGYDSHLVARKLKDARIPVMLMRPHSLPENEDDPIDLPYRLPALLRNEGVEFCIQNQGDMEAMNARNLPFLAGTAWAYGLTEEEAIQSISLNTCKILGIDKQYGSIEEGKSATFFVSEGNALDIRTNNVTFIMMRGQVSSTSNFQRELYEKYQSKYGRK